DRYEVRDDVPPGPGKFRGGSGVVKSQRYLTPGFMTHESDRHRDAPWGVFGGGEGAVGKLEISNIARPREVRQEYAKFSGLRTEVGDVVSYISPSGGGYGDPFEREPAKVLDDVLDGFITVEHAREAYGVALREIDDGYGWTLDDAGTAALRTR
ncbi:MAG: hydantoinase B/oxoprolinase family protein, partial [Pseudomonadota bacterium]